VRLEAAIVGMSMRNMTGDCLGAPKPVANIVAMRQAGPKRPLDVCGVSEPSVGPRYVSGAWTDK